MDELEVCAITIKRELSDEGDFVYTDWTEGASSVELLGLIEFAREAVLKGESS